MKTRGYIFLLAALLLCGCTQTTSLSSLLSDDTVRLEIDGVPVFVYDATTCQLSFNEQRHEFRAFTDTMLDYFELTVSAIPARAGTTVNATVVWSTTGGERSKTDVTLETKRIKGDVIWFCDHSQHTAAVVRVLK